MRRAAAVARRGVVPARRLSTAKRQRPLDPRLSVRVEGPRYANDSNKVLFEGSPAPRPSPRLGTSLDWYGLSTYVTQSVLRAANRQSERRLRLIAAVLVAVGAVLYLLRDRIKKQMTEEAAELTSRTMQHESIRTSAQAVGKSLAHEILHDPTVADAATKLTRDVLRQRETRDAALDLVVWLVERDESRVVVRGLLKQVVLDLAADDAVVRRLAELLANALRREEARRATVSLAADLLEDPRTLEATTRLATRLLEREDARAALAAAFSDAAHRALDDEDVRRHASRAARDALSDRSVQKSAGDALWNAYKYSIGLGPRRLDTPKQDKPKPEEEGPPPDEPPLVEKPDKVVISDDDDDEGEAAPPKQPKEMDPVPPQIDPPKGQEEEEEEEEAEEEEKR